MQRILDNDPVTRRRLDFHWFPDGTWGVNTVQDVTDAVEANKADHAAHPGKAPQQWKGDLHRVASIPLTVWEDLKRSGIADDPEALKRWLDDRDNLVFRTRPGRLSK